MDKCFNGRRGFVFCFIQVSRATGAAGTDSQRQACVLDSDDNDSPPFASTPQRILSVSSSASTPQHRLSDNSFDADDGLAAMPTSSKKQKTDYVRLLSFVL